MPLSSIQQKMLRRLIDIGSPENLRRSLDKLHPSDIATLFSELAPGDMMRVLEVLFSLKKGGKVLREMPEYFLPGILPKIEDQRLANVLGNLEPDDALFLLEHIGEERQQELFDLIPGANRNYLQQMILYPEDSAGSIMNVNVVTLQEEMQAHEAIDHLRENRGQMGIYYLYVIDTEGRLAGLLSMRDLLLSRPDVKVSTLMMREVMNVQPTEDKEKVAQMFAKYNLLGMPVLDENRKLLGMITVDDVIDIVKEEATEDMYYMAGLSEADRAFSPLRESTRRRLPWMVLNLATAFVAAWIVGLFQDSIVKAISLAIFMPVVAQLAGNVGIQTLTVITRSIALEELEFAKAWRAIFKEMGTGLAIGTSLGLLTGLVGYLWIGNAYLGLILFLSMVLTMAVAGALGSLIPLTLRALHLDPALGSGVVVIATTDILSFLVFLGLGTVFLNYLT